MKVPSTEVQNNFGKYLKIASELEDVIVTRKGFEVAKIVPCEERTTGCTGGFDTKITANIAGNRSVFTPII